MNPALFHIQQSGLLCSLFFLFGSVLGAESAISFDKPDLLAEALPILQTHYLDFKKLPVKAVEHLDELIAQSDGSISLGDPENETSAIPIVTAFLPENIIYWRLASFTPETGWSDLGKQLEQWTVQGATGIVLDLRSNLAAADYEGATQVAGFFVPGGVPLFISRSARGGDHAYVGASPRTPFHPPIVLIIDNKTVGAAEVLAACLKARGALVVGQRTMGKTAVFTAEKLSSGQLLRYVSARICLPDGTDFWGHPVSPDIGLAVNEQDEKKALALIGQHGVLDVIRESAERHRLSEAALMQGKNPELDDYLVSREKKSAAASAPLMQDIALIDALDSLKAIQLSRKWMASTAGTGPKPESLAQ